MRPIVIGEPPKSDSPYYQTPITYSQYRLKRLNLHATPIKISIMCNANNHICNKFLSLSCKTPRPIDRLIDKKANKFNSYRGDI